MCVCVCVYVCVCACIWSLHGKHCVVQLIRMYKSLDVVPVREGRGVVLNVGQLVVSGGGRQLLAAADQTTSGSTCAGAWAPPQVPLVSCAVVASRCVCILHNTLLRLHRVLRSGFIAGGEAEE